VRWRSRHLRIQGAPRIRKSVRNPLSPRHSQAGAVAANRMGITCLLQRRILARVVTHIVATEARRTYYYPEPLRLFPQSGMKSIKLYVAQRKRVREIGRCLQKARNVSIYSGMGFCHDIQVESSWARTSGPWP